MVSNRICRLALPYSAIVSIRFASAMRHESAGFAPRKAANVADERQPHGWHSEYLNGLGTLTINDDGSGSSSGTQPILLTSARRLEPTGSHRGAYPL